jgi:hypothetical protein
MEDDQRVLPRPEPENKMTMTPMKYRGPDVHEPKTKTVLRVIIMPDKKDLQKTTEIDRRGDTNDAEMIANDKPYQQIMYETHQEEGDDKPYPDVPAESYTAPEKGKPNTQERLCNKDVKNVTTLANYNEEFAAALATYDEEFAAILDNYDGEFAATTLANYDEEFAAALATYDEEFAATTIANYDEEFAAILANYDEEFAVTTNLAIYD